MLVMRVLEILRVQANDRDGEDELEEAEDPITQEKGEWRWRAR